MIDTCYLNCKAFDLVMRNKKYKKDFQFGNYKANVLKEKGQIVSKSKIKSHDVILKPSKDFRKSNEIISTWVHISTTGNNFFRFND